MPQDARETVDWLHEELLTVDEVADQFRVHPETVRRLIYRKELRAVKFGGEWRILKRSVNKYAQDVSNDAAAQEELPWTA